MFDVSGSPSLLSEESRVIFQVIFQSRDEAINRLDDRDNGQRIPPPPPHSSSPTRRAESYHYYLSTHIVPQHSLTRSRSAPTCDRQPNNKKPTCAPPRLQNLLDTTQEQNERIGGTPSSRGGSLRGAVRPSMSAVHPPHSLPLSPSSPPESGLKRQKRRLSDENLPDSPNSPPLMSVTATGYASIYGDARPGTSDPSQSEAVEMQRQQSASALPTPANSVAGSMKAGELDDADQHRDKRQRLDTEERETGEQTIAETSTRPTNHDRQQTGSSPGRTRTLAEASGDAGLGLFRVKTRKALIPPSPLTLPAPLVIFH
jgi:hypothetical protein